MSVTGDRIDAKENSWPKEIEDDYKRVHPLGKGAYGIVWLAEAKRRPHETPSVATGDADDDSVDSREKEDGFDSQSGLKAKSNRDDDHPPYVAIKQIHASQGGEKQYAAREIAILSELNHPNIVRCLRSTETPRSRIVVLTLADGPNLGQIVEAGGALSVSLARLAARHLVSAVAYLHGRGVIHRDIKPDNCILTKGATFIHNPSVRDDWMANDDFWEDNAVFDEWKVVLVDFGFAKALTPAELGITRENPTTSVRNLVQRGIVKQASERGSVDKNAGKNVAPAKKNYSFGKMSTKCNESCQRIPITGMSALGTRAFAAPEVKAVRPKSAGDDALSDNVSDYGLIADAFSVGCTIRALLTGVPADQNEMDFIGSRSNVLLNVLSAVFSCGKKDGGAKRKKRYKFLDEAPKPARGLVAKLTKPSHAERLTVPLARDELWIKGGISADDPVVTLPMGDIPAGIDDPIKCLSTNAW